MFSVGRRFSGTAIALRIINRPPKYSWSIQIIHSVDFGAIFWNHFKTIMSASSQPPAGGRQNKGPAFLTVALVFTIIALMFVLVRVYVRIWVKPAFG